MIALLNYGTYFVDGQENVKDFLISYANYIGLDMKIFTILADSDEMSTKDLVEYLNRYCGTNEEILEIYEIGKKHF